jgi:hypothetical protein
MKRGDAAYLAVIYKQANEPKKPKTAFPPGTLNP